MLGSNHAQTLHRWACRVKNATNEYSKKYLNPIPPPAVLEALFCTNNPPDATDTPENEIRRITEQQSRTCIRLLASLDDQIADLDARSRELKGKRSRIANLLQKYNSVFHPIRHIPGDILLLIFRMCVDDYLGDITFCDFGRLALRRECERGTLDIEKAPWVLSHVCRRWRMLTLSLPWLWTHIVVDAHGVHRTFKDPPKAAELLELSLARCGSQPLSITYHETVFNHYEDEDEENDTNTPLFAAILAKSSYWLDIKLNTHPIEYNDFVLPHPTRFKHLVEVHFHFRNSALNGSDYEVTTELYAEAPNLTRLFLYGYNLIDQSGLAHIKFPWVNSRISNVERATGRWREMDAPDGVIIELLNEWPRERPLRFPSVHTLEFVGHHGFGVVSHLVLPSLKSLTIRAPVAHSADRGDLDYVIGVVKRSDCKLEELGLLGLPQDCDGGHLIRVLEETGNTVQSLSLGFPGLGDPWDEGRPLLPHLRHLTLRDISYGWAHKVVRARRKVESEETEAGFDRLERLDVEHISRRFGCNLDADDLKRLEEFCAAKGIAFDSRVAVTEEVEDEADDEGSSDEYGSEDDED
ncbi:hypothetical protein V5O48_009461 [Marasmius crinis-equi]|uniref:F-box domain-containing protein n=1 Tax=Marasmius crinis-equi TaxID=585013 RepID=A0ABR3FB79_9AGAR